MPLRKSTQAVGRKAQGRTRREVSYALCSKGVTGSRNSQHKKPIA